MFGGDREGYQEFQAELAKYKHPKPDAPSINLAHLKSLVKGLLDKHFKKIAITTAISLAVSGIFTWLVWPKSESQKIAEVKAEMQKMEAELEKANQETARLVKEKEELLAKTANIQNVKNEAHERQNEKKEKRTGSWIGVIGGFLLIGFVTLFFILAFKTKLLDLLNRFNPGVTAPILGSVLALCLVGGIGLVIGFWPGSETVSETVQQNSKIATQEKTTEVSSEKSKPMSRKFISRATITYKEYFFDKYNYNYFFYLKLDDGRKGKLRVDNKFFALANIDDVIAIYEDDKFELEKPLEEKKEEPKKKRVEY